MPTTLLDTWQKLVRAEPHARAVIEAAGGKVFTRAELAARAEAWQAARTESLNRQRVVFALPNGAAWFEVFLGLLQAGAVPAALDASEPLAAQRELAHTVGASWLWFDGRLEKISAPRRPRRHDICLVKITSGSTGAPRALPFTHAQILADGRQVCRTMGIGPGDLNLAVVPLGHSYGLVNLVVPLLAQGTPLVCASAPMPHALAADCVRWRPTVFPAVPVLLRALAASDITAEALRSLRLVISAGAPLPAETAQVFFEKSGRRPQAFYGTSETGGITFDRKGEATRLGRSVGTPLSGVRLRFGRGSRFEVVSAAVCKRGKHSPADRGKLDEQGELVLLGRAGRMVKIAGRRLDLTEIEAALRRVPGVRDALATPHPAQPDELAAALATDLSAGALRGLLRERLAAWKIPRRIVVLPAFPLTARGKTDTRALKKLLAR
ncbi:MAG TPA: class I adenylate-forming enzyme family protein [Opitutaceae bacterium]|nr:class I adenylate-forming enzyme family protein [Opitutaceae bacterium]